MCRANVQFPFLSSYSQTCAAETSHRGTWYTAKAVISKQRYSSLRGSVIIVVAIQERATQMGVAASWQSRLNHSAQFTVITRHTRRPLDPELRKSTECSSTVQPPFQEIDRVRALSVVRDHRRVGGSCRAKRENTWVSEGWDARCLAIMIRGGVRYTCDHLYNTVSERGPIGLVVRDLVLAGVPIPMGCPATICAPPRYVPSPGQPSTEDSASNTCPGYASRLLVSRESPLPGANSV